MTLDDPRDAYMWQEVLDERDRLKVERDQQERFKWDANKRAAKAEAERDRLKEVNEELADVLDAMLTAYERDGEEGHVHTTLGLQAESALRKAKL